MDLDARLLAAWERGLGETPLARALVLLELARPQSTQDELAAMSIGRRDRALVRLRERLFGRAFDGHVECPGCRERLAVELVLSGGDDDDGPPASFVTAAGLAFRAPDSRDLASVAHASSDAEAVRLLLSRCCTSPAPAAAADWTDEQIREVESGLAALGSPDELCIDFTCDACGRTWQSALDPSAFLWEEIEAHALRLLRTVHALAGAYGWSEREILSMPPTRRAAYLQMVEA